MKRAWIIAAVLLSNVAFAGTVEGEYEGGYGHVILTVKAPKKDNYPVNMKIIHGWEGCGGTWSGYMTIQGNKVSLYAPNGLKSDNGGPACGFHGLKTPNGFLLNSTNGNCAIYHGAACQWGTSLPGGLKLQRR